MTEKKHFKTFKEFLEFKKKEQSLETGKPVDWDERKKNWLSSIDHLYGEVDKIIVANFKNAGYNVNAVKEDIIIHEDYIGSYTVKNYVITADIIKIMFNPVGTIILGAKGRVNMVLPNETVKLILFDWNKWKIVKGIGGSMQLLDFNEQNIMSAFEGNI